MSKGATDDRPADGSEHRSDMHLQCIGSFKARTQDGEVYTIEIWTHFGAVHDRERTRVEPSLNVLTTTNGRGVVRVEQGVYRLFDCPEIGFSTDDPNAP